jgi:hypothetical protein
MIDLIDIDENEAVTLNDQEKRLVLMIRAIKYGELHLYISDGKPIRAEKIIKSVKL